VTRRYVDAISGTGARIVDTRKTTPGLRLLEKYAVTVGGGSNHRMGLDDGVLIKDNHLLALQQYGIGPAEAVCRAKSMVNRCFPVDRADAMVIVIEMYQ
jgi:nicotinate-nucleotide pyrophosphorylase (carboxylating)